MVKVKMVCPTCGSENVYCDAWASWDVDTQQWVVADTFDAGWCNECDGEQRHLNEVPIQ